MRHNADITVYNRYVADRDEAYWSTQIKRVTWEDRKASNKLASGGDIKADAAYIYIPMTRGRDYLSSKQWQELESKGDYWTLQTGDVVVRGLVDDEIASTFTLSDLKRKYDDVIVISSVDLNDNATKSLAHWKVAGS